MCQPATQFEPELLDWEYDTVDAGTLGDVRDYLYRRRKQGWKLFWIEGRVLHFRRLDPNQAQTQAA